MSEHDAMIRTLRARAEGAGFKHGAIYDRAADALAALVRERDEAREETDNQDIAIKLLMADLAAARAQVATLREAASAALHELITLFRAIAPAANVGETNRAGEGSPAVIALRAALEAAGALK